MERIGIVFEVGGSMWEWWHSHWKWKAKVLLLHVQHTLRIHWHWFSGYFRCGTTGRRWGWVRLSLCLMVMLWRYRRLWRCSKVMTGCRRYRWGIRSSSSGRSCRQRWTQMSRVGLKVTIHPRLDLMMVHIFWLLLENVIDTKRGFLFWRSHCSLNCSYYLLQIGCTNFTEYV